MRTIAILTAATLLASPSLAATAPNATTALAGTGPAGPGRICMAARAVWGSRSKLAVFITDQTPLRSGWAGLAGTFAAADAAC